MSKGAELLSGFDCKTNTAPVPGNLLPIFGLPKAFRPIFARGADIRGPLAVLNRVGPFLHHLDRPSPEERVVECHGRAHRVLVRELHVGEALGVRAQMTSTQKGEGGSKNFSNSSSDEEGVIKSK